MSIAVITDLVTIGLFLSAIADGH